jgi:hypothetical protein
MTSASADTLPFNHQLLEFEDEGSPHHGHRVELGGQRTAFGRARAVSSEGTLTRERSPQVLQRSTIVSPSFDRPTISVRWLPHFGHIGGGICARENGGT